MSKAKRNRKMQKSPKSGAVARLAPSHETDSFKALREQHPNAAIPIYADRELAAISTGDDIWGSYKYFDITMGIKGRQIAPNGAMVGLIDTQDHLYLDSEIFEELATRRMKVIFLIGQITNTVLLAEEPRKTKFLTEAGGMIGGLYINYCNYVESIGRTLLNDWISDKPSEDFVLPIEMEKRINQALRGDWNPLMALCKELAEEPLLAMSLFARTFKTRGAPKVGATQWLLHNADRIRKAHREETGQPLRWHPDTWQRLLELVPSIHEEYANEIERDLKDALSDTQKSHRLQQRLRQARSRKTVT